MDGPAGLSIVLNGEIYGFQTKRKECADYPFRSRSDTEVALALYQKYGENFVEQLDGMFALALWDEPRRKLLLARDRTGEKPLYCLSTSSFFAFASEIKALLTLPDFSPVLDSSALPLYLTFGYVPTPGTFYTGIRKLEPATLFVLEEGKEPRSRRYWSYPIARCKASEDRQSLRLASSQLRELLRRAVDLRMVSDVPLGAFLSGGIDSSIIVGIMSQLSPVPVRTFSIGFAGDPTYDERSYARIVATHFRTEHTEFRVDPNAVELLDRLIWHYDEPFGDSSAIPTYIISKLTREKVTVALSGDGGDELFAGYERFSAALWSERVPNLILAGAGALAKLLPAPGHAKSTRRRVKRFLAKARMPLADRYLEWNSFFSRDELSRLLLARPEADVAASFLERLRETSRCTLLQQLLYLNFATYLLDDLLVKTDRMSMACGLEVRCPFLDTRLVEWAALIPDSFKVRGGKLKFLLKHAYRDLLPGHILRRSKMGFGVPLGAWLRKDLREISQDLLLGESAKTRNLIRTAVVKQLLREHLDEAEDHGQKLWALLCLEMWLRKVGPSAAC
jgi:asparagine synthase (glutamine-hydrolysing)